MDGLDELLDGLPFVEGLYDRDGRALTFAEYFRLRYRSDDNYPQVALTEMDGVTVATVWLGMNTRFGGGWPPLIFETFVFGGAFDLKGERYATEADALAGHAEWTRKVSDHG